MVKTWVYLIEYLRYFRQKQDIFVRISRTVAILTIYDSTY